MTFRPPDVILLTDHTDTIFLNKLLGPHKVAHELRRAGYHVVVINHLHIFSFAEITHLLKTLVTQSTLYVGINSFWYKDIGNTVVANDGHVTYPVMPKGSFLPHGKDKNPIIKKIIKDINPSCKIVLGGPDATDVEWNKDYDIVQCGYSDVGATKLANYLRDGILLEKNYKSIYGFTVLHGDTPEEYDISTGTMHYEPHDVILDGECLPLEISRGCIFQCDFCAFPLNGKEKLDFIRHKDQLRTEMIENYEKYGVTRYMFVDDTFNDSEFKVQMIHDIAKSLPFKLEFWAYSRLDLLANNPTWMDLQLNAGQRGFFFGIESFNKKSSAMVGKGTAKEKLIEALHYLKNKGGNNISLHGSFIVGLPHETLDTATDTFNVLMNPGFPLDSWWMYPYLLENRNLKTNGFLSKMALNYEKYGYRATGEYDNYLYWENDHMDSHLAANLVDDFRKKGEHVGRRCLQPVACFWVSGLGFDLEYTLNVPIIDINWYEISQQKERRANEYKQRLFSILEIPVLAKD
jgi:hypothetical protein